MSKIKKFILIFIFSSLFPAIFIGYVYGFNSLCKSGDIFSSLKSFGIRHIQECILGTYQIREKIKTDLLFDSKGNKRYNINLIYNFLSKKSRKYYSGGFSKDNFNTNLSKSNYEWDSSIFQNVKGIIGNQEKLIPNYSYDTDHPEYNEWIRSHGGNWNTNFSSNNGINKNNILDLSLAWKHVSITKKDINNSWKQNIELNPIYYKNKIFYISADWTLYALDALTGDVIWKKKTIFKPSRRGMVISKEKNGDFIFLPISQKIYKINIKDGSLDKNFNRGKSYIWSPYTITAPMIYKNYLISVTVGSVAKINIHDKFKGNFVQSIPLHPKDKNFIGGSPWGGVAMDAEKGIVYITTGNPQPGTYGINRPGKNERSVSVIAFDINKRKIIWDFQEVIHDLWDYDIPSPPTIHNLRSGQDIYETVIIVTKVGNTIILDRNTGKNLYDINFEKVSTLATPGESPSPYQKSFSKPEKFSSIEFNDESFSELSKQKKVFINKELKNKIYGKFIPPSFEKDLVIFGLHGGAQWMGATIDPKNQNLYVPYNKVPHIIKLYMQSMEHKVFNNKKFQTSMNLYKSKCSSCHGKIRNGKYEVKRDIHNAKNYVPSLVGISFLKDGRTRIDNINLKHNFKLNINEKDALYSLFNEWDQKINKENLIRVEGNYWYEFLTPDGLPASNPPWGGIAKLNLITNKIEWKKPVGKLPGEQKHIGLRNFGGIASNSGGLLFFTGTSDSNAYILDQITGEILWSFKMDGPGSAPPTLFEVDGNQYVAFLSTGGQVNEMYKKKSSVLYTFRINTN